MRIERAKTLSLVAVAAIAALLSLASAALASAPNKEIQTSSFGWEVDATTKADICAVASGDACQSGHPSPEPGGFEYPTSVAGAAKSDDIYVLDRGNHRIQELEADGKFILMFGTDVNRKGGDLCTAAETKECQAGTEGTTPGQFAQPQSIAVDPQSGNIYVAEFTFHTERVQEFTPNGEFVLEIGHEVNETKDKESGKTGLERNLCTAEEAKTVTKCTTPTVANTPEPGAFAFAESANLLAVGGPEDLLYIGEEHRIQVFDAKTGAGDGHYEKELSLTAISAAPGVAVTRIALDQTTGDLYVVYEDPETIRQLDPAGAQIKEFTTGEVLALAVNGQGLLAVSETVAGIPIGSLYEVGTSLHLISRFASHVSFSFTFNENKDLYGVVGGETSVDPAKHEVIAYEPVPIGELIAAPGQCAVAGASGADADVAFGCALEGEVDPWGVPETSVWFQWGRSERGLSERTVPPISLANTKKEGEEEPLVKVSAPVVGLLPNETIYDEVIGEDHNVRAPETITSAVGSFTTPSVPPRVLGEPVASFPTPTSVVMVGRINPEHTPTRYGFEYAPLAGCPNLATEPCSGRLETSVLSSPTYGGVPIAQEVTGLQPATSYRYRLVGENETSMHEHETAIAENGEPGLPEGTFQTAPAPAVTASTGAASLLTTTSALVSGAIDPDGEASTYAFEVGVDEGVGTRYGIVQTASIAADTEPQEEMLQLTGLQPGITYSYRISIHFGEGNVSGSSAVGEARTFTTLGLPEVLTTTTPPLLSVPHIAFPKPVTTRKPGKKAKKKHKPPKKKNRRSKKSSRSARTGRTRGHGKKKA